jgi:hypothetical protein
MRVERERKKKLIVAFHFLSAGRVGMNQALWKCEPCRRQGLEARRRCGFLPEERRGVKKVVWARGGTVAEECPTSLVTPASIEFLESFFAWKTVGRGEITTHGLTAREAEAFLILEREWRMEQTNGQQ